MAYQQKAAASQVYLGRPGLSYEPTADGFGGPFTRVADVLAEGTARGSVLSAGMGTSGQYTRLGHDLVAIDDRHNAVTLPLLLDTDTAIGAKDYVLAQSGEDGEWLELEADIGASRWQWFTGATTQVTYAKTRFDLPLNCPFIISIWRAGVAADFDYDQGYPITELHWGVTEQVNWGLLFPYGFQAEIGRYWADFQYYDHDAAQIATGGKFVVAPNGKLDLSREMDPSRAQQWNILVWPLGDRFLITNLDSLSVQAGGPGVVYRWPGYWIWAPEGPLQLAHNAGQWAFRFVPVYMPEMSYIVGPNIDVGYDKALALGGYCNCPLLSNYYYGGYGTINVGDGSGITPALGNYQVRWLLTLGRNRAASNYYDADDAEQTLYFDRSPIVHGLQLYQVGCVGQKSPGGQYVTDDVIEVEVEAEMGRAGRLATVTVDNHAGAYADMAAARDIKIKLGWFEEEIGGPGEQTIFTTMFTGMTVEPEYPLEADTSPEVSVACIDNATKLAAAKADGRVPIFDNWLVTDILTWVLARCNIPAAYRVVGTDIENLGLRTNSGLPDEVIWRVEPGRAWLDFLREDLLAKAYGGADLWIDGDGHVNIGCPYCRTLRSASPASDNYWAKHDGWASVGCLAADVTRAGASGVDYILCTEPSLTPEEEYAHGFISSMRRYKEQANPEEWANIVVALVQTLDGASAIRASFVHKDGIIYDESNPAGYQGYPAHKVVTLPTGSSQAEANRKAWEEFRHVAQRPDWIRATLPLVPALDLGMVVETRGVSDIDIENAKWRVASVRHRAYRSTTTPPYTEIRARYIGQVA